VTIASTATDDIRPDSGTLFGHPKGLYVLFLTEMWERFSFYGVRALLVFFLSQRFLFSDASAFGIYGSYSALVYIYPLLGGILADRYFGYNRSVMYGAVLMVMGHIGLVLQELYFKASGSAELLGGAGSIAQNLFYLSLAFVIAGVGLLKSNISTMVGKLYPRESQMRDAGFTIFNWGINIGATLAAFSCGYVGQTFGWEYGFGLAGAGMVIGLIIFIAGQKFLRGPGGWADGKPLERLGTRKTLALAAFVGFSILVTWQLLPRVEILGYIVIGTVIFALSRAMYIGFKELNRIERERLWCALIFWSIWSTYAALVEQMGSSINLFNERLVNRHFGAIEVRSAQLIGVTSLLLLLLAPFFVWLWGFLDKRGRNPSTPAKLCFAHYALASGYTIITIGTLWPDSSGRVNLIWVLAMYLCFAVAALVVGPIGLSAITRLAATRVLGFLVGLWMLGVALGSYVASKIAGFSALSPAEGATLQNHEILAHYQRFFGTLALAGIALAIGFTLLAPLMKKWMNGLK